MVTGVSGKYERIDDDPDPRPHPCRTPGAFSRWRNHVGFGTIWQCECGRRYRWVAGIPLYPYPFWEDAEHEHNEMWERMMRRSGRDPEEPIRGQTLGKGWRLK